MSVSRRANSRMIDFSIEKSWRSSTEYKSFKKEMNASARGLYPSISAILMLSFSSIIQSTFTIGSGRDEFSIGKPAPDWRNKC